MGIVLAWGNGGRQLGIIEYIYMYMIQIRPKNTIDLNFLNFQ